MPIETLEDGNSIWADKNPAQILFDRHRAEKWLTVSLDLN